MMIKPLSFYISLTLVSVYFCVACGNSSEKTQEVSPKKLHLERAVLSVEMTLGAMGDSGYVQWTPTTAAEKAVDSLNASQVLVPGEEEQYREARMKPVTIPYTLNKATDKWQVVIIPDEENSTIKVEGYGSSLEEPLFVKTIPCCYF
ncbi:MAG: hypothetical protein AB4060_18945 [Crocosphaera sp.]